jgi:hypothetical protein
MSDLSILDQSFGLLPASMLPPPEGDLGLSQAPEFAAEVQPHQLSFRQLRGAREIAHILHLRDEIALSSATRADASFASREKKETRPASSAPSYGTVNT